ncbi:protein moonraker isoform X2 [Salarias fasciatus]|uniref:protein moonraker isoform X2 n=1 Tax=Salarias fasciatus TaxID=181472 RepID=UPI001176E8D3|nr:protein moonraker isoform X2 [Salarias fasciatus]
MTPSSLQSAPSFFLGQQSQKKDWVRSRYDPAAGMSNTKLLFNEAIPASASNRASHVGPPAPIVIERLLPLSGEPENTGSTKSSFSFTALSEERLQAAVKLAKRDLRRRRLDRLARSSARDSEEAPLCETSGVELLQESAVTPEKIKSAASDRKGTVMRPCTKHHTIKKHPASANPRVGLSPPTRDPGPRPAGGGKEGALSHEIHRLQQELEVHINKVEALAKRGEKLEEPLEAEEQAKLELHRKKQAAHSARIIYVLQQQVKEVQEEVEKIRSEKTSGSKKTEALNRLAAAHRRALGALRVFNQQLSEDSVSKAPPQSRELGQLVRQLCLCSAKLEVDRGSAVPEAALDILQKLETLDCALSKQELLERLQAQTCPPHRKSAPRSASPPAAPRGLSTPRLRGAGRAAHPRGRLGGRKAASQMVKRAPHPPGRRRDLLRAAVESLSQQRALREQPGERQKSSTCRAGPRSDTHKAGITKRVQTRDAGFQRPTVSSRLRVNQLPQKESSVPWKPTSPHSPPPPPRRSPERERAEPRCLFSPVKPPRSPPKQPAPPGLAAELDLNPERRKEAQNEALRTAWLDRMTTQRLTELRRLSEEEEERLRRLRSDAAAPARWAERAEREARERIQPLLDEARAAGGGGEQVSEALLEELLDDATRAAWAAEADGRLEDVARRGLQAPVLESMLLRLEEIQKDQEEVRRRFASISYSDPLYRDRAGAAGPLSQAPGSRPASPQPIRLTRPAPRQTSVSDIILEKPVEAGSQCESSLMEEPPRDEPRRGSGAVLPVLSVPGSMLGSIRQYREDYDSHLRSAARRPAGGFNPRTVVESVADELLSEAVADVAAEFQDVVEQYAEAVFTSEFLQPVQSPPASAAVRQ